MMLERRSDLLGGTTMPDKDCMERPWATEGRVVAVVAVVVVEGGRTMAKSLSCTPHSDGAIIQGRGEAYKCNLETFRFVNLQKLHERRLTTSDKERMCERERERRRERVCV